MYAGARRHAIPATRSTALVAALLAALGTATAGRPVTAGQPAAEAGPPQSNAPGSDDRPPFVEWLAGVRAEALSRGIRREIVERALDPIEEPLPAVLARDRTQAEVVLSLEAYIARRLTSAFVRSAREMASRHRKLLDEISRAYGVPGRVIVAVWGVESNFGRFTGAQPTIAALATLAWDPRRSAFFRTELFHALEILDRGHIELDALKGSWAGAMGQPQFMPSSYLRYAVDFDGDARRDIWRSQADVFASIANYLKGHGWTAGERWGREVRVPRSAATRIASSIPKRSAGCRARRAMTVARPLAECQSIGVRSLDGKALPTADMEASLVSGEKRHFLVYSNYEALLGYNCAHPYALTVALLSDRVS
jgi:membrane-bound lytic murein transglycosylase B